MKAKSIQATGEVLRFKEQLRLSSRDQLIAPTTQRCRDISRYRVCRTAESSCPPHRVKRTAMLRGAHDHRDIPKRRDQSVAEWKRAAMGTGSIRMLTQERSPFLENPVEQRPIAGWTRSIHPSCKHRDGRQTCIKSRFMSRTIDPSSTPADHHHRLSLQGFDKT